MKNIEKESLKSRLGARFTVKQLRYAEPEECEIILREIAKWILRTERAGIGCQISQDYISEMVHVLKRSDITPNASLLAIGMLRRLAPQHLKQLPKLLATADARVCSFARRVLNSPS